jgi:hypothetical protein
MNMEVFVYSVSAKADLLGGKQTFELRVIKHLAKDTGKSIMFDGRRIAKEKMNISSILYDSHNMIGCHMFTLEDGLEEAKKTVVEETRKLIEKRFAELNTLRELIKQTPVEIFKDRTID